MLARLSRATDAVREEVHAALTRAGFGDVRPGHGCVFGTVGPEGSRVTDVALATGFTKQAVGEVANDLEQLGYVERVPDPDDRRAKILLLTERGRTAQAVGREAIAAIERRLIRRYGKDRLEELVAMLGEIAAPQAQRRTAA